MLSVFVIGCGGAPDEPIDVPNGEYVNGNGEIDNGETADYSHLIGTWQGYAIAVTQTVVITDVQNDVISFYFENISSIDPEFNTTSSEITRQIVNNQITAPNVIMSDAGEPIGQEITLTFYDDYIRYEITGLEDIWWALTRIDD